MSISMVTDIELISAAPEELLNAAVLKGICLSSVKYLDSLRVCVTIRNKDIQRLREVAESRGDKINILDCHGIYSTVVKVFSRPILLVGMLIWLVMVLYLPTRILFVEVEGNRMVSTQQIIGSAQICGIYFGASRRNLRNEQVKNTLLEMLPQLQWVGVNTFGCRAVISIVERTTVSEKQPMYAISSIVASRDGIISGVTVTKGNALCKVGQAVRSRQLLVSPYTDCGLLIKAESAEGEIFAITNRSLTAVTPSLIYENASQSKQNIHWSLRIGNKIINLCKDSGILDTTCATMYEEKVLRLPGGFALPVALIRETVNSGVQVESTLHEEFAEDQMRANLLSYLNSQMVSGNVLHESIIMTQDQDCYVLQADYICEEMIGKFHVEERLPNNE